MTRAEKDAALNELVGHRGVKGVELIVHALQASKIFSAMLGEVIMDTAIQVKKEVTRSKSVCNVCNTRSALFAVQ